MNSFIYIIFFIFVGIIINMTNNIALKYTVNKFIETKSKWIILSSFFIRMLFLAVSFYLVTKNSIQKAILVTIGIIIGRISLSLQRKRLK